MAVVREGGREGDCIGRGRERGRGTVLEEGGWEGGGRSTGRGREGGRKVPSLKADCEGGGCVASAGH